MKKNNKGKSGQVEIIEGLERAKEIQRMQYDYFKYLIPLSTGSILILIAFIEKVLRDPLIYIEIILLLSLTGFVVTIISSLWALPSAVNMITYINKSQQIILNTKGLEAEKLKGEAKEQSEKIGETLDKIGKHNKWAQLSFSISIALIWAGIVIYFLGS